MAEQKSELRAVVRMELELISPIEIVPPGPHDDAATMIEEARAAAFERGANLVLLPGVYRLDRPVRIRPGER